MKALKIMKLLTYSNHNTLNHIRTGTGKYKISYLQSIIYG